MRWRYIYTCVCVCPLFGVEERESERSGGLLDFGYIWGSRSHEMRIRWLGFVLLSRPRVRWDCYVVNWRVEGDLLFWV